MTAQPHRDGGRALRNVALAGAVLGLAGLTAAACVLSYSSMHHLAIQAGVSARLASVYPLIFDALLVVSGCSVLALRGAGLVSKLYGWLCMLVLLGCLAAGGAVRAAAVHVPRHLAGVVAAIVPWALVLIGFGMLLALLRYARIRRAQGSGQRFAKDDPGASAYAGVPDAYDPGSVTESDDGGVSDRPVSAGTETGSDAGPGGAPVQASALNPAPTCDDVPPEIPPFRRARSSPTPPAQ